MFVAYREWTLDEDLVDTLETDMGAQQALPFLALGVQRGVLAFKHAMPSMVGQFFMIESMLFEADKASFATPQVPYTLNVIE